jgi:hypothetical protein
MFVQFNPLLEGLEAARRADADAVGRDGEVIVDDQPDRWVFQFIPRADALGGGARVAIAKDGLRVLSVVREQ